MRKEDENELIDVVVVGAGLSGISCALSLCNEELDSSAKRNCTQPSVLVLEAQDYIGGRVKKLDSFLKEYDNTTLDLGAEFIHGQNNELYTIAQTANEPVVSLYNWAHGDGGPLDHKVDGGFGMYYDGSTNRLLNFNSNEKWFQRVTNDLANIANLNLGDIQEHVTLNDYYEQCEFSKSMVDMADAGFANTLCSNSKQLSLTQMVKWMKLWEDEGEQNVRVVNGFYKLVEHLSAGVNIVLNSPVNSIDYSGHTPGIPVTLTTLDGRVYHCKRVVVTASVSVISSELIKFYPPLPPLFKSAVSSVVMQPACKIVLLFSTRPFPPMLHGMICSGSFVPEFWFRNLSNAAVGKPPCIAVGFATAAFAQALFAEPKETILTKALDQLDNMFIRAVKVVNEGSDKEGVNSCDLECTPTPPSSCYIKGMVYEWSTRTHPYIGGGYACPLAGADMSYADVLSSPIDLSGTSKQRFHGDSSGVEQDVHRTEASNLRLFFAGEATVCPGATADAALLSGRNAAISVRASL